MSAWEWKPGDVGINSTDERFLVTSSGECAWESLQGDVVSGSPVAADRPLVVIDPEAIVEDCSNAALYIARLLREADENNGIPTFAALADVFDPPDPKPDEPRGLGAVVEDAEGLRYVRAMPEPGSSNSARVWIGQHSTEMTYANIAAVRVLSEGWSE